MSKKGYLILQNGVVCEGERFGAVKDVVAELVFNTSVVGYLESITDPSYHGQIVLQTFPLIGNYGVIPQDFESAAPALNGYVVEDLCDHPSNFRSEGVLGDFFAREGVAGLCGVDTRALTKMIRDTGVMNAAIVSRMPDDLAQFCRNLAAKQLSSDVYSVSRKARQVYNDPGTTNIVLWDFGCKNAMIKHLTNRGCRVVAMPASSSADSILAEKPDGIFLSNGPGDPAKCTAIIENIKILCKTGIPIFGICLGHQLLALANGAKSRKLKYGHRGGNQPVRDLGSDRLYMTSQNHGYEIYDLTAHMQESYVNLNDGTNEGIRYIDIPAFSVQFHPEACGGPLETGFLFDDYLAMIGGNSDAAE